MSRQIFFSIEPKFAGLSDQLLQFSALYNLGLSLGYTYWHIPFLSIRSREVDSLDRYQRRLKRFQNRLPLWSRWINKEPQFDVYDFIGLSDYFQAKNEKIAVGEPQQFNLMLNHDAADQQHISSLEGLQIYVRNFVAEQGTPGSQILLTFGLEGKWSFWQLIFAGIPNYSKILDLRAIYFAKREIDPWPSEFLEGKVKSMIHIRQGDTAVLPTPWNTFVALWPPQYSFIEYAQFDEMPMRQRVIFVEDYFHFYKNFTAHCDDSFSTLLFSDGFKRSLQKLSKQIERLDFTQEQEKLLSKDVLSFDKTKYRPFESITDCRLFVGEEPEKLCHLIHSFLTADLLIIGSQLWMFPKLVALYCDAQNMPIVIVLHKADDGDIWRYDGLNLGERLEKIIFVNLNQPDYPGLAKQVSNLLQKGVGFTYPMPVV